MRNWILSSYPTAVEDASLSLIVMNWLSSTSGDSIFNYVWYTANYNSKNLSASSVTGTYSATIVSDLTAGTHLKQPDSVMLSSVLESYSKLMGRRNFKQFTPNEVNSKQIR